MSLVSNKKVAVYRFIFNASGNKVVPMIEKIDVSRQVRDVLSVKPSKFIVNGKEELLVGDNNNVIQIDISKVKDIGLASWLLTARYYMRGKGQNMRLFIVKPDARHIRNSICVPLFGKDAKIFNERQNMTGFCRFGGKEGGQISTNSNLKKGILTLLNNNNVERIHKIMDTIDYGCLSSFIGKTVTSEKAAKLASRLGNWMAVKEDGQFVENFAIYFGEFANGDLDGMSFTTLVKTGCAVQNRAYLCKTVSLGITVQTMDTIINSLDKDPIVIDRSNITDDLNKEIRAAIDCKGKGTRFENHVLIIKSTEGGAQYLADMNVLKASFDVRRMSTLNVIKEFGGKESTASLSSQILTKLMFQSPLNAKEVFKAAHERALSDKFTFKPVKATKETVMNDGFFTNSILDIDPDAMRKYGWVFRNSIDQVLMGDRSALNEFHMPIEGANKVMIGDLGALFGVKLLNADEIFSNGLDAVVEYTSFKFPTFDQREYANVRNIADVIYDRIADAVNEEKLTAEQGAMLHDLCQDLDNAVVMYAAMPIVKARQAGFDFDGDCAIFIKSDILGMKNEPVAIKCGKPESKDNSTTTIGWDIMAQAMAKIWSFGNLSVGTVTNIFTEFQYMELNHDVAAFRKFARFDGNFNGSKKYTPVMKIDGEENNVKYVEVSEAKIRKILDQIPEMILDEENIMDCLHDINMGVGRWYQESTIDAAKKFYRVEISGALQSVLQDKVSPNVWVSIDWANKKVKSVKGQQFFTDKMRRSVQNALTAKTQKMAQDAVNVVTKMPKFGDDVKSRCIGAYKSIDIGMKGVINVLVSEIKNANRIYTDTHDKDAYGNTLAELENMFRMATFDFDPESRVAVLLGYVFDHNDEKVLNKIGTKMLRAEFVQFVAGFSNKEASEELKELEVNTDPSVMTFRIQVKDAKFISALKDRLEKGDDEDVTVKLVRQRNSITMALGDTIVKHKVNNNVIKSLYVDCGGYGVATRLTKIFEGREGKVASCRLIMNSGKDSRDGKMFHSLLVTLYDVTKENVTVKAKEETDEKAVAAQQ